MRRPCAVRDGNDKRLDIKVKRERKRGLRYLLVGNLCGLPKREVPIPRPTRDCGNQQDQDANDPPGPGCRAAAAGRSCFGRRLVYFRHVLFPFFVMLSSIQDAYDALAARWSNSSISACWRRDAVSASRIAARSFKISYIRFSRRASTSSCHCRAHAASRLPSSLSWRTATASICPMKPMWVIIEVEDMPRCKPARIRSRYPSPCFFNRKSFCFASSHWAWRRCQPMRAPSARRSANFISVANPAIPPSFAQEFVQRRDTVREGDRARHVLAQKVLDRRPQSYRPIEFGVMAGAVATDRYHVPALVEAVVEPLEALSPRHLLGRND